MRGHRPLVDGRQGAAGPYARLLRGGPDQEATVLARQRRRPPAVVRRPPATVSGAAPRSQDGGPPAVSGRDKEQPAPPTLGRWPLTWPFER